MVSFIKKFSNKRKGMTLMEVVISLAVLGIISVPLFATFINSAVIIKKTDEQLEINAVTKIIKENVVVSVKGGVGNTIPSYETDEHGNEIEVVLKDCSEAKNLKVVDSTGRVYSKYKFDAQREKDYGEITNYPDTCEYLITLKRISDEQVVQKIRVDINRLD